MTQYRQGDVFIVRVSKPKEEGRLLERRAGRIVLAEGEASGHAHAIAAPNASLFEVAGKVYLAVAGDCVALEHEEHDTIELPAGYYEIIRQREYSPEAIRNVQD